MPDAYAHRNTNADSDTNPDQYLNADTHEYAHQHPDEYTDTHCNEYPNANANGPCTLRNDYANTNANPEHLCGLLPVGCVRTA